MCAVPEQPVDKSLPVAAMWNDYSSILPKHLSQPPSSAAVNLLQDAVPCLHSLLFLRHLQLTAFMSRLGPALLPTGLAHAASPSWLLS